MQTGADPPLGSTNLFDFMIDLLITIGVLTLISAAFIAVRWAWESSMAHYYYGLKDQIKELGDELTDILESEGRIEPETRWAIAELTRAARTREWRGRDTLKGKLEAARDESNETSPSVDATEKPMP